jgi:non-ribosomal peptide synthase protein (TIGR01720 family)
MQAAIDYWTRAAVAPDTGSSANTGVPDTEGDARNFTLTAELPTNVSVTGDALATALYSTISEWTGSARVRFEMIGHGRICPAVALDPAATVGYFAMRYPVQLDSVSGSDAVQRELDSIPDRGISWGMLRYLHPNQEIRDRLAAPSRPEISLNYHGQAGSHAGSLVIPTAESVGLTRDLGLRRACKLQLFATRTGNGVSVTWRFNPRLHDPGTILTLAARFSEHLKTVIGCATPVAASFGSAS